MFILKTVIKSTWLDQLVRPEIEDKNCSLFLFRTLCLNTVFNFPCQEFDFQGQVFNLQGQMFNCPGQALNCQGQAFISVHRMKEHIKKYHPKAAQENTISAEEHSTDSENFTSKREQTSDKHNNGEIINAKSFLIHNQQTYWHSYTQLIYRMTMNYFHCNKIDSDPTTNHSRQETLWRDNLKALCPSKGIVVFLWYVVSVQASKFKNTSFLQMQLEMINQKRA